MTPDATSASFIFDPNDSMVPEQTCPHCGAFIGGGEEVIPVRGDHVAHKSCAEDLT
jgi:hypothetical protein